MRSFDVVVMGAGSTGEVAAGRLADGGLDVAIIEEHLVGGECSYYACMPSKSLLRPPEALAEAERIPGAREAVTRNVDVEATLDRRDEIVNHLHDDHQLPWLEERGITLVRGEGVLVGERRVRVGDEELEARRAVLIATGSDPAFPPIEGLDSLEDAWTNREATTARDLPDTLVIVGGGVVGVELAQAYQELGTQVILVEGERRLLPREEEFACAQVTDALAERGVEIRTGQKATKVEQREGQVHVTVSDGTTAHADRILVALGRRARTQGIGVETIGLEPGASIEVDEHMRVPGHPWLYAAGDVNGIALFTHMGKYQARIAADHILGKDTALSHVANGPGAPRVVFTDPQVAAVGHTSDSARAAGLNIRIVDVPTSGNAGGSFYGRDAPGTSRIIVDEDRRVIVGATITGSEVADYLQPATFAVVGEIPLERLWHGVAAYPTRSEIWLKLLESYGM